MLDARMRTLIDPVLNTVGRTLAAWGLTANGVTLIGLALGLIAAATIALGAPLLALIPLLFSRIADGLDGAVARANGPTNGWTRVETKGTAPAGASTVTLSLYSFLGDKGVFDFDDALSAIGHIAGGKVEGKVIVRVREP